MRSNLCNLARVTTPIASFCRSFSASQFRKVLYDEEWFKDKIDRIRKASKNVANMPSNQESNSRLINYANRTFKSEKREPKSLGNSILAQKKIHQKLQDIMYQKKKSDLEGRHSNGYISRTSGIFFTKLHREMHYLHKLASSIRNNEPSIVIDFRGVNSLSSFNDLKRLSYLVSNVLHANRVAPVPFKIHFCNYNRSSEFHSNFSVIHDLDQNLVFDTSESYTNLFSKQSLVYLSMSGLKKLKTFDPCQVYVIEASLAIRKDPLQLKAFAQAKKDGISCQHLPISDFTEMRSVNLESITFDKVFAILSGVYNQNTWKQSLVSNLFDSRQIRKKLDEPDFEF